MPDADHDGERSPDADGRTYDLHGVVVQLDDGRTRCTVYPRRLAHDERTTRWLSADQSAFRGLEEMR